MRSLVFATVVALSGCSLFVSLDGLNDDGDTDGGGVDATSSDATPSDAPLTDAPLPDVGVLSDGASSTACPSGSYFCDDFETGDFSKWDSVSGATSPSLFEVTTAKAWRGTHSMHVDVEDPHDAGTVFNFFTVKSFPAVNSGTIAFRAYVFAPATPFQGAFVVDGHGLRGGQMLFCGAANGNNCPNSGDCVDNALSGAATDFTDGSQVPLPTGKWVCLEWVTFIGTSGTATAYVDGLTVVQSNHNTTDTGGGYTSLNVGFVGSTGGQELFYDDVVIANERIGCE